MSTVNDKGSGSASDECPSKGAVTGEEAAVPVFPIEVMNESHMTGEMKIYLHLVYPYRQLTRAVRWFVCDGVSTPQNKLEVNILRFLGLGSTSRFLSCFSLLTGYAALIWLCINRRGLF